MKKTLKYDRSNVKKYGPDEEGEHQIEEKLTIQVYENKLIKSLRESRNEDTTYKIRQFLSNELDRIRELT